MITATLSLRRVFYLLVFITPIWPDFMGVKLGSLPALSPTTVLLALLALGLLFKLVTSGAALGSVVGVYKRHRLICNTLAFFLLWKILTAVTAEDQDHTILSALHDVAFEVVYFLGGVILLRDALHIRKMMNVMVLTGIFVGMAAVLEYLVGHNLFYSYATSPEVAQKLLLGKVRDGVGRVSGPFANPLALASYICFILPMILYLMFKSTSIYERWISGLSLSLALFALYETFSRAGLLVLIVTLVCIFFLRAKSWILRFRRATRGAALLFVISSFISIGVLGSLIAVDLTVGRNAAEQQSSDTRAYQLVLGVPLIISKPLVGYGPGHSAEVLDLTTLTVDNYYLTLALESGLPEPILFIILLICVCKLALQLSWFHWGWQHLSGVILSAIVGNVLFMAVLSLEQVLPMLFLAFAMVVVLAEQRRTDRDLAFQAEDNCETLGAEK